MHNMNKRVKLSINDIKNDDTKYEYTCLIALELDRFMEVKKNGTLYDIHNFYLSILDTFYEQICGTEQNYFKPDNNIEIYNTTPKYYCGHALLKDKKVICVFEYGTSGGLSSDTICIVCL